MEATDASDLRCSRYRQVALGRASAAKLLQAAGGSRRTSFSAERAFARLPQGVQTVRVQLRSHLSLCMHLTTLAEWRLLRNKMYFTARPDSARDVETKPSYWHLGVFPRWGKPGFHAHLAFHGQHRLLPRLDRNTKNRGREFNSEARVQGCLRFSLMFPIWVD